MCVCVCVCQRLEAGSLGDAVFEVVSLQREADRTNRAQGSSLAEEEEHEEGRRPSLSPSLSLTLSFSRPLSPSFHLYPLSPSLSITFTLIHSNPFYPYISGQCSITISAALSTSRTRLNSHTYVSMLNLFSVYRVCSSILSLQP